MSFMYLCMSRRHKNEILYIYIYIYIYILALYMINNSVMLFTLTNISLTYCIIYKCVWKIYIMKK